MTSNRILHGLGVAVLTLALAACGGSANVTTDSSPTSGDSGAKNVIKVVADATTSGAFVPKNATAAVGDTVKWDFVDDQNPHTVDSDSDAPAQFSSGSTPKVKGDTFSFTFTKPGTYKYHCNLHPGMVGQVTVS
jgi:plastocyanin